MAVIYAEGVMQEFISKIEFSLNFEDKTSVKVRIGEKVLYDGKIAKYKKVNGDEVSGKTSSLRSAINSNWLTLKGSKTDPVSNVRVIKPKETDVENKSPEYDPLKGGSFEDQINKENAGSRIIREEDQVVKKTAATNNSVERKTRERLETSGDQVDVKSVSSSTVSSSTSVAPSMKTRNNKVIQSEDYGSERIVSSRKASVSGDTNKAKSFTVNDSTPRLAEGATLAEVRRATVTLGAESQDAKVIKRVSKRVPEITQLDGITLKSNIESPENLDPVVKVSSGSDTVADLSGANTQADVTEIENRKRTLVAKDNSAFLSKLPADWAEMHWVKKEKFILDITDYEFLKFIMTVETTKAVINACRKRLTELAKKNG